MSNDKSSAKEFPKQEQSLPGSQQEQHPSPKVLPKEYPNGKLAGKLLLSLALIAGLGKQ